MITSPTGSRGIRVARARRLDRLGLHQGQRADSRDDRRRPARGLDVAILVLGADPPGADQLDPVPGHPVRRLASQALDPEPLGQAGGPVDRPRRTQFRETGRSATPRPRSPASIQPVQQLANLGLLQRLGPCPRRAGQPLHRVGRVHPRHPANQVAQLLGLVDRLEDHQAIPRRRRGHDRCRLPAVGSRVRNHRQRPRRGHSSSGCRSSFPLSPGRFGIWNSSPTWTEKPGRTSPPSSRIEAVSRVKWSGAV